jgi:hypothetical protein
MFLLLPVFSFFPMKIEISLELSHMIIEDVVKIDAENKLYGSIAARVQVGEGCKKGAGAGVWCW